MNRILVTILPLVLAGQVSAQIPDSLLVIADDSVRAITLGMTAANTALFDKEFEQAELMLEEAERISSGLGSAFVAAKLIRERGIVEQAREDTGAALQTYQEAYAAFESLEKPGMLVDILLRMEQLYFNSREFDLAEKYVQQALDLLNAHPDLPLYLKGDALNELANIYGEQGKHAQSLEYADQARAIYQEAGDDTFAFGTLLNSAITLRKMGRSAESVTRFRRVEEYARQGKVDYLLMSVFINLPPALLSANQPAEALAVNQEALDFIESHPEHKEFRYLAAIHDNFREIYASTGDFEQAYAHYGLAVANRDSLTSLEKKREIARLETQFESRQKEQQIALLGAENETRQWQLRMMLVVLAGALLFIGVLVWQYRRLQQSRARISEQSDQLKLLMKELHHRVKNNLAIVSSLLKLQSNRLEEESAARAVREGQHRVEAMSLIHQRLYQTDLVTKVNMRDYIIDLTENLMRAYGYEPDDFDLQLQIERQELDVDLAIPLGLILNELLTNAFKHAFSQVDRPSLAVRLTGERDLTLEIQDNGPGMTQDQWQQRGKSFGKRLVHNLSAQIGGEMEISGDNGTRFKLHVVQRKAA
ncbi:two-component sensor histidine kinase [Lewinella marina]|nr:histidine kinase dimerization/phosphoacceptor domain -containing protein [Neolewinella marina]NJB87477.1 two-component sensor histidine kinase [Neolewinella marina]